MVRGKDQPWWSKRKPVMVVIGDESWWSGEETSLVGQGRIPVMMVWRDHSQNDLVIIINWNLGGSIERGAVCSQKRKPVRLGFQKRCKAGLWPWLSAEL